MASRLVLFGLLAASGLALVASFDESHSVIPLIKEAQGSSRQQRDLLLLDDDEDYEFFNRQSSDLKSASQLGNLAASYRPPQRDVDGGVSGDDHGQQPPNLRKLLMKLQLRSDQFMDIAQKTAYSAVNLLMAFSKLVENSNDNFIILAK